jgi:hypothetical protein
MAEVIGRDETGRGEIRMRVCAMLALVRMKG